MTLREWLTQAKIKDREFAEAVGVSPQAVSGWVRGKFYPDIKNLAQIHAITGGKVLPADFISLRGVQNG